MAGIFCGARASFVSFLLVVVAVVVVVGVVGFLDFVVVVDENKTQSTSEHMFREKA